LGSSAKYLMRLGMFPTIGAFFAPFPAIVNTFVLGRYGSALYVSAFALGQSYWSIFGMAMLARFVSL